MKQVSSDDRQAAHQVTHEVTVKSSKQAVWARLVEFGAYSAWKAPIRIAGDAELGGLVQYQVRSRYPGLGDRWNTFHGKVTVFRPEEELRFFVGVKFVLSMEFAFIFTSAPGGTRVLHTGSFGGPLGRFAGRRLRRRLVPTLTATAEALKTTSSRPVSLRDPESPSLNRKARRAKRSTGR